MEDVDQDVVKISHSHIFCDIIFVGVAVFSMTPYQVASTNCHKIFDIV